MPDLFEHFRPIKADQSRSIPRLKLDWLELKAVYLPYTTKDIWAFNRFFSGDEPAQGWKIHISATILTANEVLSRVGALLNRQGVVFKAPFSLLELMKLNAGIFYGYSQVGKFITAYPRSDAEFCYLARVLDRKLKGLRGPAIPFDFRFSETSSVFYRFGAFKNIKRASADDNAPPPIVSPSGNVGDDDRLAAEYVPAWKKNPLPSQESNNARKDTNPLRSRYQVFRAHVQRGKGGVYEAYDTSCEPPQLVIIKEGRRHGETNWDGRDGRDRLENEFAVLRHLLEKNIKVPKVLDRFELAENFYLTLEHINGISLQKYLDDNGNLLSLQEAAHFARQAADQITQIHAAGWIWRDCKPANLIITDARELRPIDFEGACRVDRVDPFPWSTFHFLPNEGSPIKDGTRSALPEDLYALGCLIYLLFEGILPDRNKNRTNVLPEVIRMPSALKKTVLALLDSDATRRPTARSVCRALEKAIT